MILWFCFYRWSFLLSDPNLLLILPTPNVYCPVYSGHGFREVRNLKANCFFALPRSNTMLHAVSSLAQKALQQPERCCWASPTPFPLLLPRAAVLQESFQKLDSNPSQPWMTSNALDTCVQPGAFTSHSNTTLQPHPAVSWTRITRVTAAVQLPQFCTAARSSLGGGRRRVM